MREKPETRLKNHLFNVVPYNHDSRLYKECVLLLLKASVDFAVFVFLLFSRGPEKWSENNCVDGSLQKMHP